MLLLASVAAAAPLVLSATAGAPVFVDRSGNWARALPSEGGWDFFFASGGDYWHAPLDDALAPDLAATRPLTGRSDLVDHAITRCPDGTFLHAASYTVASPDDSLVVYRYGADLDVSQTTTIEDGGDRVITRDMPLVCGDTFEGVGLFDERAGSTFVDVRDGERVVLDGAPMTTGSGWIEADGALLAVGHDVTAWGEMGVRGPDAGLAPDGIVDLALAPAPLTAYWSQGVVRVGDGFVVVFMARDESAGWQLQDGNVWLAVFDADWTLVEARALTDYAPPVGAMQPGLAVKGDELLVTYTYDLQPYVLSVTVDPSSVASDPGEDGTPFHGGCAEGAAALLVPLFGRWRRRR